MSLKLFFLYYVPYNYTESVYILIHLCT